MLINSIAIIVLASAVVVNTLMIRRLQQDAQEPPPRREPRIECTVTVNEDVLREMRKMSTWRGPSGHR